MQYLKLLWCPDTLHRVKFGDPPQRPRFLTKNESATDGSSAVPGSVRRAGIARDHRAFSARVETIHVGEDETRSMMRGNEWGRI